MPTYEYRCKSCGHGLEVVQSFTDEALTKCPACKKKQLKKVFGSIGITFKGSGFYKTDSRSGSSSPSTTGDATSSETKTETKADTTTGSKSESKPEKAAEKKAEAKPSATSAA